MGKWAHVDWERLNEPRHEMIRGVQVTVYFSPYDMPEAVKGEYDKQKDRFSIQFRYLGGDERIHYRVQDEHITLGIGETTKRLHEIQVDVEKLKASLVMLEMRQHPRDMQEQVAAEVTKAIKTFASATTTTSAPTGNYTAASKALDQQRQQVFSVLAGS